VTSEPDMGGGGWEVQIDRWTLDCIRQGKKDFDVLLVSLPGVYPVDVLDSLRRLVQAGAADESLLTRALSYVSRPPNPTHAQESVLDLPVPHPLDYAWRFGSVACRYLLDRCLQITNPRETVLFMGAPNLYLYASKNGFDRQVVLLDSDTVTVRKIADGIPGGAVCCNIVCGELPEVSARVVVADPPWYPEYMKSFVWAAASLAQRGGMVLLCFPPIGTRPTVAQEWLDLKDWACTCGLTLRGVESRALPYASPPFERNALAVHGILTVPVHWRHADLACFEVTHKIGIASPQPPLSVGDWCEQDLRNVRVRVRSSNHCQFSVPSLVSLVPGDILSSVSRRDSRRSRAQIWTSGNRIFDCHGPHIFVTILRAMAEGSSPYGAVTECIGRTLTLPEQVQVDCTVKQITDLITLEEQELFLWG
jgi:hypothetical protein